MAVVLLIAEFPLTSDSHKTIRRYLHSIIDSDRKQEWKVFEEGDESLMV